MQFKTLEGEGLTSEIATMEPNKIREDCESPASSGVRGRVLRLLTHRSCSLSGIAYNFRTG